MVSLLLQATVTGCPGAAYIDIPSDVLMGPLPAGLVPPRRVLGSAAAAAASPAPPLLPFAARPQAQAQAVAAAAQLLRAAKRCPGIINPS
jgi:thiamine pyrophosphate-dependent acetolactate synthase large subunit-like protein